MNVISKRPFSIAATKYPNNRNALMEIFRVLRRTDFKTPVELKALMMNHNLTGSDLPEVGDKTMVSKVLNEKRPLTRPAIERLAKRFGIRPAMFFGE